MKKTLLGFAVITTVATSVGFAAVELTAAHGTGFFGGQDAKVDIIAEALGVPAEELHDSLKEGILLTDLAEEQGIAPGALRGVMQEARARQFEELVASGEITQEQSDAHAEHMAARMESKASVLGLTVDELDRLLDEGDTIMDIMERQGITKEMFMDAHQESRMDRLNQQLADGDISQDEYDRRLERNSRGDGKHGFGKMFSGGKHHRQFNN